MKKFALFSVIACAFAVSVLSSCSFIVESSINESTYKLSSATVSGVDVTSTIGTVTLAFSEPLVKMTYAGESSTGGYLMGETLDENDNTVYYVVLYATASTSSSSGGIESSGYYLSDYIGELYVDDTFAKTLTGKFTFAGVNATWTFEKQ